MRILFDQGTPVPLRTHLGSHQIETAFERGWSTLKNGELLILAQQEGFEVLVAPTGICATNKIWLGGKLQSLYFHPPVGHEFKKLWRQ